MLIIVGEKVAIPPTLIVLKLRWNYMGCTDKDNLFLIF